MKYILAFFLSFSCVLCENTGANNSISSAEGSFTVRVAYESLLKSAPADPNPGVVGVGLSSFSGLSADKILGFEISGNAGSELIVNTEMRELSLNDNDFSGAQVEGNGSMPEYKNDSTIRNQPTVYKLVKIGGIQNTGRVIVLINPTNSHNVESASANSSHRKKYKGFISITYVPGI